jgi:hypothetical protein
VLFFRGEFGVTLQTSLFCRGIAQAIPGGNPHITHRISSLSFARGKLIRSSYGGASVFRAIRICKLSPTGTEATLRL